MERLFDRLMRRGWTRDSLKPGDRVKVAGAPAKNFPAIAIANSIRDGNDKPLFTGITRTYEPERPKEWTTFPPTIVYITFADWISSSGTVVMSFERTVTSASLPTVSDPLMVSSKAA